MLNALISAIPSIFNVFLVCIIFWLLFSIAGVQLLGAKFHKCVDKTTGERLDVSVVNNKSQCLELIDAGLPYSWENSKINFDNSLRGYLALFQVVSNVEE